MSNFDDLYQGFIIMLSFCVIGLILAIFGGYILDHVFSTFDAGGFLDVPPEWNSVGSVNIILNLWYLTICIFPVVGIGSFIKTIIGRTGSDQFTMQ